MYLQNFLILVVQEQLSLLSLLSHTLTEICLRSDISIT